MLFPIILSVEIKICEKRSLNFVIDFIAV